MAVHSPGGGAASVSPTFTNVTITGTLTMSALNASQAVFTDASKNLVSNAITGTGNVVMSTSPTVASPTLTGTTAGASLSLSSLTATRIPIAGTAGLLVDSANLIFTGGNLLNVTGGITASGTVTGGGATPFTATASGVNIAGSITNSLNTGTSAWAAYNDTGKLIQIFQGGSTYSPTGILVAGGSNLYGNGTQLSIVSAANTGAGFISFGTSTSAIEQFRVIHTASANQFPTATGTNGAGGVIGTSAGILTLAPTSATVAVTGALTASGTITMTATSSTGTALIQDGPGVIRPLTSSRAFKQNINSWTPTDTQLKAFLNVKSSVFDYEDHARELKFTGGTKLTLSGEDREGVKGVVGFIAEDLHDAGLPEMLNYKDGNPYSLREHGVLAYLHAALKNHEARLVKAGY